MLYNKIKENPLLGNEQEIMKKLCSEREDLIGKTEKLSNFISSENFKKLTEFEQRLMYKQKYIFIELIGLLLSRSVEIDVRIRKAKSYDK